MTMSPESLKLETQSPEVTEGLGFVLAQMLPIGSLVCLFGDLASGKTCLVRGMARHFARDELIHSPTFTLVNEYGKEPTLYHLDLYRLGSPEELADLGYEELFDSDGVCAVEWAERAEGYLPECRVEITLEHGGKDLRQFTIDGGGVLPSGWKEQLMAAIKDKSLDVS
jgi:tRNA threonylcarbamoyladenosine biosynthesis protein TsaE